MVMLGYESTVRVTLDEMLHHTRAVVRGTSHALVVGDMPFLSYGASVEESVEHAGRFMREAGAQAVKVEGGVRSARIDRGHRRRRHPGHGPHRADAPGESPAGRLSGCRASRPRLGASARRRCAGRPGGGRIRDRARARARAARARDHRAVGHPDHRHRRGAVHARARSRSSPTSSGSRRVARPGTRALRRGRRAVRRGGRAPTATPSRRGRSPVRSSRRRWTTEVLDDALGRGQAARTEPELLAHPARPRPLTLDAGTALRDRTPVTAPQ